MKAPKIKTPKFDGDPTLCLAGKDNGKAYLHKIRFNVVGVGKRAKIIALWLKDFGHTPGTSIIASFSNTAEGIQNFMHYVEDLSSRGYQGSFAVNVDSDLFEEEDL